MVRLPEVKTSLSGFDEIWILIRALPSFDERQHDQGMSARAKDTMDFTKRLRVIDMFQDVRTQDNIKRLIVELHLFDIDLLVGASLCDIGGDVAARQGLDQRGERFLRRKMKQIRSDDAVAVGVEPELEQAVAHR